MITEETRVEIINEFEEKIVSGYFLTIYDMARLTRDFQVDCHDGFVSNDLSYVEHWLKKHDRI